MSWLPVIKYVKVEKEGGLGVLNLALWYEPSTFCGMVVKNSVLFELTVVVAKILKDLLTLGQALRGSSDKRSPGKRVAARLQKYYKYYLGNNRLPSQTCLFHSRRDHRIQRLALDLSIIFGILCFLVAIVLRGWYCYYYSGLMQVRTSHRNPRCLYPKHLVLRTRINRLRTPCGYSPSLGLRVKGVGAMSTGAHLAWSSCSFFIVSKSCPLLVRGYYMRYLFVNLVSLKVV